MNLRTRVPVALSVLAASACGNHPGSSAGLNVVRETLGDTVVVRTLAGSLWGAPASLVPELSIGRMEGDPHYLFGDIYCLAVASDGTIYVLDGQAAEVRAFDASGVWARTLGRSGKGPGELNRPNGLAVLSDGRVLVSDPGNQRIQTYDSAGTPLQEWPYRTSLYTSSPLWSDRDDNSLVVVLMEEAHNPSDWRLGLIRYGSDGTIEDTMPVPRSGFTTPHVEGHSADGGASVSYNVPFAPAEQWAVAFDGSFVHGVSTDYRIDFLRRDAPPLRIERAYDPVRVQPGERAAAERGVVRGIRLTVPDWRWNGPAIPDHKPPFGAIRNRQAPWFVL